MLSDGHAQVHLKVGEGIVKGQSSKYFNNRKHQSCYRLKNTVKPNQNKTQHIKEKEEVESWIIMPDLRVLSLPSLHGERIGKRNLSLMKWMSWSLSNWGYTYSKLQLLIDQWNSACPEVKKFQRKTHYFFLPEMGPCREEGQVIWQ